MNTIKKKGLGRGLTALFGDQKTNTIKSDKVSISRSTANIADLRPNKYQPRVHFDQSKLQELANSIKKKRYNSAYSR